MPASESRVVIVGGGFGGLFSALELAGSCSVTLITDEDHFLFTPMLYEYLSGEVEEWHIAPKYGELIDDNIRLIQGAVTNIDLIQKRVTVESSSNPIEYDILILAVGGITNYAGVPGAEEFAIPFRKIAHADTLRSRMVSALDHVPPNLPPQDTRRALTFAVVGAGASGVASRPCQSPERRRPDRDGRATRRHDGGSPRPTRPADSRSGRDRIASPAPDPRHRPW